MMIGSLRSVVFASPKADRLLTFSGNLIHLTVHLHWLGKLVGMNSNRWTGTLITQKSWVEFDWMAVANTARLPVRQESNVKEKFFHLQICFRSFLFKFYTEKNFFEQFGARILTKRSFFVKVGFCCHLSRKAKSFVFPSFHVQKVKTGEEKNIKLITMKSSFASANCHWCDNNQGKRRLSSRDFSIVRSFISFLLLLLLSPESNSKGEKLDKRRQMMTVKSRKFSFASADEFPGRPTEVITKLRTQTSYAGNQNQQRAMRA